MQIVTIIENNPITGVRYGTIEIKEYNNNIKRRLDRFYRSRTHYKRMTTRGYNTKHR